MALKNLVSGITEPRIHYTSEYIELYYFSTNQTYLNFMKDILCRNSNYFEACLIILSMQIILNETHNICFYWTITTNGYTQY